MSVFLQGSSVLLNGGNVATSGNCCCCPDIFLTCDTISAVGFQCCLFYEGGGGLGFLECEGRVWHQTACGFHNFSDGRNYRKYDHGTYSEDLGDDPCSRCFRQVDLVEDGDIGTYSFFAVEIDGSCTTTCTCSTCSGPGGEITINFGEYLDESDVDTCEIAVTNLPPYDGDFDDECLASRFVSTVDGSCTIQRFLPKFTIPSPRDNDLFICYNEHFVPDVGSPSNTPKVAVILAGDTEVIGDEVLEPDEDGNVTITDIQCC